MAWYVVDYKLGNDVKHSILVSANCSVVAEQEAQFKLAKHLTYRVVGVTFVQSHPDKQAQINALRVLKNKNEEPLR